MLSSILKGMDEKGEKIAGLLSSYLADDQLRNLFLARLSEFQKGVLKMGQEQRLTKREQVVSEFILAHEKPFTAEEAAKALKGQYKALGHRTHAANLLNALVEKGVLGRYKVGYHYYYTTPKEAVMQILAQREEIPGKCSPTEISKSIGMPLEKVLEVLKELIPDR